MHIQPLKRLLKYVKPYRKYFVGALIGAIGSVFFTLLTPIIIGQAVDLLIGKGLVDFTGLLIILRNLAIVVVMSAVLTYFMQLCTNQLSYRTVKDLREELFSKLEEMPLKYIDTTSHGEIISRIIVDIDLISDGLLQGFSNMFTGIMTIVGTLIFMMSINFNIAMIVFFMTPISLVVASLIAKFSYKFLRGQLAVRGEMGGFVEEYIGQLKLVKAFSYESVSQQEFEEINGRLQKIGVKAQVLSAITGPSTRFVNGLVYAAVGIYGALSVVYGHVSIGQLSSFLSYANQYTKPFNDISSVITELQSAVAAAQRIFGILDQPSQSADHIPAVTLEQCEGKVDINHVDFSYQPSRPLITDLNIHVQPGQRIAIVGPTGCGKTTIINLLMRFYDINNGSIKIQDEDMMLLPRDHLRGLYGMVLQDTWVFGGTIKENIAYGKKDATDEEIIVAAKKAYAHSFIKRLPQGYDTIISDDGNSISQGQKQLLSIARVMLLNPPMLILDEATSSIDTLTEIRVQRAFDEMMKGKTSFIVAHRLSTIKNADTILVMNAGKIIEQGTHNELLKKEGFYANLYLSQFAKNED